VVVPVIEQIAKSMLACILEKSRRITLSDYMVNKYAAPKT